jgi:hypothetical protein
MSHLGEPIVKCMFVKGHLKHISEMALGRAAMTPDDGWRRTTL